MDNSSGDDWQTFLSNVRGFLDILVQIDEKPALHSTTDFQNALKWGDYITETLQETKMSPKQKRELLEVICTTKTVNGIDDLLKAKDTVLKRVINAYEIPPDILFQALIDFHNNPTLIDLIHKRMLKAQTEKLILDTYAQSFEKETDKATAKENLLKRVKEGKEENQ
eukprot:TRINITY_DN4444_c0_g2_i1.p1 TRINITY_DN4444_c0_g2~~TRINITY_DN4444_c0_g2_i1.p1  ORF type:complete len:167 (+),score=42.55 TRINITY_DN4444_c0_g2_i1:172-672(+)